MENSRTIAARTVLQHNKPDDCWIVVDDEVWDVTTFHQEHPGGASSKFRYRNIIICVHETWLTFRCYQVILKYAGRDATEPYAEVHSKTVLKENLSLDCFRGNLDRTTIDEEWQKANEANGIKQGAPQAPQDANEKPPLHSIINL